MFISKSDRAFFFDADKELADELVARLERYIIADDVQIEDVTERFSLFHFLGDSAPAATNDGRAVASGRFGLPGWDLWSDGVSSTQLRERFENDFTFCDEACAEVFRIERGIPRWGRELTSEFIPVEANLEATSIDYERTLHRAGSDLAHEDVRPNDKRLCGLVSISGDALTKTRPRAGMTGARKSAGSQAPREARGSEKRLVSVM